jgi:hypothetical protein
MIQRLHTFEENCFYKYSYDLDLIVKEKLEEKLDNAVLKIDYINSRIDDIFFKENLTKSSLNEVELRLKKFEDAVFETMHITNGDNKTVNNWRNITKQKIIRSVTLSGAECLKLNNSSLVVCEPINTNNNNDILSRQSFLQQKKILDKFKIHPFIDFHSVVKPPLAEYTSITDCIDTSKIDRPPSPQMQSSHILRNASSNSLNFVPKISKLTNIKDYCERAHSVVARQESAILRLAEEDQNLIINQMFIEQASIDDIERDNTDKDNNLDSSSKDHSFIISRKEKNNSSFYVNEDEKDFRL